MKVILELDNLSFHDFKGINLSFTDKTYYSVIGSNNSGKTTLFKLIAGIIPSNDMIMCDYVELNKDNIQEYITKIGVVNRVNKKSFIYNRVIDEMTFPLHNLGYSKKDSLKIINELLEMFNVTNYIDKTINDLDYYDKQLLLIIISLLHRPKVLLLDGVLDVFSKEAKEKINNIFRKIINSGITIINFTNSLDSAFNSDKIILLDNFKVVGEYNPSDFYNNDKLFYEHNLEIPFIVDLTNKLKMYNLVNKEYLSVKEMVDDLWP